LASVAGKTLADFPELLKQWHPTKNGNIESREIKAGSGKRYWWLCNKKEDHEWKTKVGPPEDKVMPYAAGGPGWMGALW
jgi:hypothetical protein